MTQFPPRGGKTLTALALAGLMFTAAGAAQAEDLSTVVLVAPCAGCHGPEGSSLGPAAPTIAGLSKDYFVYSMEEYANGNRPATVMGRIAKGYSKEDFARMADYFTGKEFKRISQPVEEDLVKQGGELAQTYCADCHEQDGRVGDGTGILAGQMLPYMQWAVEDFRSGAREMERRQARMFQKLEATEGADAFNAIVNFYASQQ